MKIFRLNPQTRLYLDVLQASRESLASGQISFFGRNVERQESPLRFWAEWFVQAILLAMPVVAIAGFFGLIYWTGR